MCHELHNSGDDVEMSLQTKNHIETTITSKWFLEVRAIVHSQRTIDLHINLNKLNAPIGWVNFTRILEEGNIQSTRLKINKCLPHPRHCPTHKSVKFTLKLSNFMSGPLWIKNGCQKASCYDEIRICSTQLGHYS
jgi:hypothetical protein